MTVIGNCKKVEEKYLKDYGQKELEGRSSLKRWLGKMWLKRRWLERKGFEIWWLDIHLNRKMNYGNENNREENDGKKNDWNYDNSKENAWKKHELREQCAKYRRKIGGSEIDNFKKDEC